MATPGPHHGQCKTAEPSGLKTWPHLECSPEAILAAATQCWVVSKTSGAVLTTGATGWMLCNQHYTPLPYGLGYHYANRRVERIKSRDFRHLLSVFMACSFKDEFASSPLALIHAKAPSSTELAVTTVARALTTPNRNMAAEISQVLFPQAAKGHNHIHQSQSPFRAKIEE